MTYIRRLILALVLLAGSLPAFAQVPAAVPALPDTERRTSYSISASTCACAVNFALYGDSTDYQNWVEVFINGVRYDYNDVSHGWTITTPSGSLSTLARPITNAVLTFNAVQTGTVQIVGARRPRRTSQFNENTGVSARNLNQVFTDIISQNREIWDKTNDVTGRAILSQPGDTLRLLPTPAARASSVLGFDALGNTTTYNASSAVTSGANVTFLQAGTGALSRTIQNKARDIISAKDFALCDGVTAEDTAWTNALASATAVEIVIPPNTTCLVSAPVVLNSYKSITGAGRFTSALKTTSALTDIIQVVGYYSSVRGITIGSTVPKVGGVSLNVKNTSAEFYSDDILIAAPIEGISVNGASLMSFTNTEIGQVLGGGVGIRFAGGTVAVSFNHLTITSDTTPMFAALVFSNSGDVIMNDVQTIGGSNCIYVNPVGGQSVDGPTVTNSFFDSSVGNCLETALAGNGIWNRAFFGNSWFGGGVGAKSVSLISTGTTAIKGVNIVNSIPASYYGATHGIYASGNVTGLVLSANTVSGFPTAGVQLNNILSATVTGNNIGPANGRTVNGVGLIVDGTSDKVAATGNNLCGNTAAITNTASGANNSIFGNDCAAGDIPINNFNSGTGATATTFWSGDKTWKAVAGSAVTGDALTKVDDTNVTLTLGGTPATSVLRATSITAGWTGTLARSRGGTGTSAGAAVAVKMQKFTAGGTYTPSTGLLYAVVECVGSGGGGGAVAGTAGQLYAGGGGASGSYSRVTLSAATIGVSQTVTIGAAGTGGTAGSNNGSAGSDVSLGTLCVGKGGSGGLFGSAAQVGAGGAGGVAGTGDLASAGAPGGIGFYNSVNTVQTSGAGVGGTSYFGGGASGVIAGGAGAGNNAGAYGSGGSGAQTNSASNFAGGNGSTGVVYIQEFTNQ